MIFRQQLVASPFISCALRRQAVLSGTGYGRYIGKMSASSIADQETLPRSTFNNQLFSDILALWLKDLPLGTVPAQKIKDRWFGLGDDASKTAFDNSCKQIGIGALEFLSPGSWKLPTFIDCETDRRSAPSIVAPFEEILGATSTSGQPALHKTDVALAIVILLDQFPRNIFREPSEEKNIYNHYDRLAVAIARSIVDPAVNSKSTFSDLDQDARVHLDIGRNQWLYLPLMHSEDPYDHELLISKLNSVKDGAKGKGRDDIVTEVNNTLSFEKRHWDLLKEFGRYPHRNECLGRQASSAEQKYLEQGGERFGRK